MAAGTPGGEERAPGEISAGRVGRAHGLDGSFYVTRARPRLLVLGARLAVGGQRREVVRRAGTDANPIVRLEGLAGREAAESLRGLELTVESRRAPRLEDGEWWAHELEGCEVYDGERAVGRVARLVELPSCEALEVLPAGGGNALLIPMVSDAIREISPAEGRIEIDLGFLDVGDGGDAEGGEEGDERRRLHPVPGLV